MDMKKCESCGMPMSSQSDFGGRNINNRFCKYCTYENGTLRPKHEVRENMIAYYMRSKKLDRKKAESYVDEIMAGSAAWQ